ncbi:MAG: hypothetical protein ACFFBI_10260 [Promethearchaeota archaeon]
MKIVGIIIDQYHLTYKVADLLNYLKSKAEVNLYIEESYLLKSPTYDFEEDVFFVKGKGELILSLVKLIEETTLIPIINSYKAICLAINRFLNSTYLRKAGIPVPDFSLNPKKSLPPFKDYIIKNIIDQKNYKFHPVIKREKGHLNVADERALNEADENNERYNYYYYQKFIQSKWEYKIYGIGENVYFYKQIPVLIDQNKMKSRQKIKKIPELEEYCLKAMEVTGLKVTSLDFQKSKDNQFFLTDINSTPNFNYIKDGYKIVGDFLLAQTKR